MAVGGLLAASVLQHLEPRRMGAVVLLAAVLPLTALHEAAHALVARAFGWRVLEIAIGVGPLLRSQRWGEAKVELRLLPLGGYVVPVPREVAGARLASTLIYLAGPASEAAVIGLIALGLGPERLLTVGDTYGVVALQAVAGAAAWGVVVNLLPIPTASGQWTDGLGALLSPFAPDAHFERQMWLADLRLEGLDVAGDPEAALAHVEPFLARFPTDPAGWAVAAAALTALGRRGELLMGLQAALRTAKPAERSALGRLLAEARGTSPRR